MITKERIKALAQEVGFHTCGIAIPKPFPEAEVALREWSSQGKHGEMKYLENYEERKNQFWKKFPDAKSVIVLGVNYFSRDISSPHPSLPPQRGEGKVVGRVARYAWGEDYHKVIARKFDLLKEKIRAEAGYDVQFESAVDTKPILERALAQRAGFGFIGKQTQLLSLQFGPWLFLAELITDLELEADEPFQGSCGTCRLCIDECPTQAIEESGYLDARKCIAYLTIEHKTEIPIELRSKIGNWVFGCDECLTVCPYTAKQKETDWPELTEKSGVGSQVDLLKLFEIKSNREYEEKFQKSPISRANRKQLLRNACVVLGNLGSEKALPTLKKALNESSALIREHARWAIEQIQNLISSKA
ncbi:MAG: tRNA epoxyqueuosine(34) reductase QueG [Candidatus Omnitrophica bacterium]|nr:tRNA epoxyqueuosine(34) reductase QueG [Candidatus Omnitrophota bacterium]